jgi:O-antigen/teichoic acid export membrane protein
MTGAPATPSLLRNTAFNVAAAGVSLAVGMVLSPVLLAALGLERFGLWSLLWAITGSLGLVDLRLAAALGPIAAAAWTRGEGDRLGRLASTGLSFYAALGAVELLAAAAWVRTPLLVAWIPAAFRTEGRAALELAVGVFALSSVTAVFTSLLYAVQRFDLAALITIGTTALRGAALALVARGGGGLGALLLAEGAVGLIQCAASAWAVRRLLSGVCLFRRPDPGAIRQLLSFGGKLQVAHAAHLISLHGDKLLLSVFLGLGAVAYYDLGSKVAYLMRALPLLLISAAMPAASALGALGDRTRLWGFYLTGTRLLVFAATPILVVTLAGAGPILLAWTGIDALEARQAIWVLAVGYYLNLVSGMANSVAVGIGKPELEMRRSLLVAATNLALSAGLIPLVGFPGAPLGTAIALGVGSVYLIRAFNAEFGQPFRTILGLFRAPLLAAIPAAAAAIVLLQWTAGGRRGALAGLAASALTIGAGYLWLGIRDGVTSEMFADRRAWISRSSS